MSECVAAHGCITCGDAAVPMRVLQVDRERSLALCSDPAGEHASVETTLVEPIVQGDLLLVHAGTALARAAEQRTGAELPHPTAASQQQVPA